MKLALSTDESYERFLAMVPAVEREMIVNNGIILRKNSCRDRAIRELVSLSLKK